MNDSQKQWLDMLAKRGGDVPAATVISMIDQIQASHRAETDAIIRDAQDDMQAVVADAGHDPRPTRELLQDLVDFNDKHCPGQSLNALAQRARQLIGREADAVQGEDDACDCGKIEHGRHHMLCPALKRKGGA